MSLAPEKNSRAWLGRLAILVVGGVVVVLVGRYYVTRPLEYECNGVSVRYPRTWELAGGEFSPPAGIDLLWAQGFALDDDNGAGIAAANIGAAVPEQFLEQAARQTIEPTLRSAVEGLGGTLTGPESSEVGGREGLIYRVSNLTLTAVPLDISIAMVTDGAIVYFIACQNTAEHKEEVNEGCATITESFEIGG